MEDPTLFQGMKPHFPEHEQLKCPRCDSANTKFCYYNNYNLSQPRHFCKDCRRYWTKGGTLRNIPVGGSSRKNKRPNPKKAATSSSSSASTPLQSISKSEPAGMHGSSAVDHDHRMLDVSGSFSSLLYSNGQFGNLMESTNSGAAVAPQILHFGECVENENLNANSIAGAAGDPTMELAELSCWNSPNGWPDLAIYTPGSRFQ